MTNNIFEGRTLVIATKHAKEKVAGDFRRANSSLFISRKKFETVIKTIFKQ